MVLLLTEHVCQSGKRVIACFSAGSLVGIAERVSENCCKISSAVHLSSLEPEWAISVCKNWRATQLSFHLESHGSGSSVHTASTSWLLRSLNRSDISPIMASNVLKNILLHSVYYPLSCWPTILSTTYVLRSLHTLRVESLTCSSTTPQISC